MQVAAIALVAASLLSAGAAAAADRVSDMDYLRASRCSGLATGLKGADAPGLAAFVKQEGRQRDDLVAMRAQSEYDRARREAKSADRHDRLTEELAHSCAAYVGAATNTAAAAAGPVATR